MKKGFSHLCKDNKKKKTKMEVITIASKDPVLNSFDVNFEHYRCKQERNT